MQPPSHPYEQVCFFPVEFPSAEGDVYAFSFVDLQTGHLTMTGMEQNNHPSTVLSHIKAFTKHDDFLTHFNSQPFTLIIHKYKDILKDINQCLAHFNGSAIINDKLVAKIMEPVIRELYQNLNK